MCPVSWVHGLKQKNKKTIIYYYNGGFQAQGIISLRVCGICALPYGRILYVVTYKDTVKHYSFVLSLILILFFLFFLSGFGLYKE